MRFPSPPALLPCALLLLASSPAAAVSSFFDSDLEGWLPVGIEVDVVIGLPPMINSIDLVLNGGDMVHQASGGNPGGYARLTDATEDPASFASAPASFLGDLSAFIGGTFSFDHRLFDTGMPSSGIAPYSLLLTSGDPTDLNTLVWTAPAPTAATDWVHFDVLLNGDNLTLLQDTPISVIDPSLPDITPASVGLFGTMTFEEIMADVDSLLLAFELVDNDGVQMQEHGGIDNVTMVVAPEPAPGALVGFGLLALALRRRGHAAL